MIKKIITSGCSFTYGHGLPDCIRNGKDPGEVHSKFAWPSILSGLLDCECVNLSTPGGSNQFIIHSILNYDLNENDTVVILWSFLTRDTVFTKNGSKNVGEWDSNYMKYLNTNSNDNDIILKNLTSIFLFTKYLESKNINIYYAFLDPFSNFEVYPHHQNFYDKIFSEIKPHDLSESTWIRASDEWRIEKLDLALDNVHPGTEFQKRLGSYFYNKIKDRTLI